MSTSSVSNRYARAIHSTNLKVDQAPGDADVLIATGWCANPERQAERQRRDVPGVSLASLLQRLRVEFDRIDRQALLTASHDATSSALLHIPSLMPTKLALYRYVSAKAARASLKVNVERIADKLLDYFLDSVCPGCNGVAFEVIPGSHRLSNIACQECQGTGTKGRRWLGLRKRDEYELYQAVQADMTRKMDKLDRLRANYLK